MGVTSELAEEPRPDFDEELAVELRGYEVARKVGDNWVQVAAYRPNAYGFNEMLSSWQSLAKRNPSMEYDGRAIVSIKLPRKEQVEVQAGVDKPNG